MPSLVLLCGVGGTALTAAWFTVRRRPPARAVSLAAGAVLVTWIIVQVGIIGPVSWLQPAMLVAGLAVVALAARLPPAPARLV